MGRQAMIRKAIGRESGCANDGCRLEKAPWQDDNREWKSLAMRCWWVGEGRLAASPSEEQYISGRERDTWSAQRIE